ncbi:MAG: hypothetical protein IKF79_03840 [Methanosphaera sp.]|nr:hypothetical protein [Methanosphaera sp.]
MAWFVGPFITKKLGLSNKIYINKSFNRLKAKYLGYLLILFTIIVILMDYNNLKGVNLYNTMIPIVCLLLFAVMLIFRNDFLNLKYSSMDGNDKYYLDFVNIAVVPLVVIALLTNLTVYNDTLLIILVMLTVFVELIVLVFSVCPDKLQEYYISRKASFDYKQFAVIIIVLSVIPVVILFTLIILLTYIF